MFKKIIWLSCGAAEMGQDNCAAAVDLLAGSITIKVVASWYVPGGATAPDVHVALYWDGNLWFSDAIFAHTGSQRAAVEPKDFSGTGFSAYFPLGLLKHPKNVVAFNGCQSFLVYT